MTLKAIETHYDGYRFRSRLEARWAVFFDTLGIEYEYEKEGYDLGEAGWYLPDFWLPQVDMWAEVKPVPLNKKERYKVFLLTEMTEDWCLELVGVPDNKAYRLVLGAKRYYAMQGVGMCVDCYLTKESFNEIFYIPDIEGGEVEEYEDTEAAVIAARSARFEFGDRGTVWRFHYDD